MGGDFHIKILSPSARFVDEKGKSVMLPGVEGYMTILPDHAPMVAKLGVGTMTTELSTGVKHHYFLSGGFIQVEGSSVTVLADIAEHGTEIDLARAKAAKERAKSRLDNSGDSDLDVERANEALKRADLRVMIANTLVAVTK